MKILTELVLGKRNYKMISWITSHKKICAILFVFFFSFFVRLATINKAGKLTDEVFYTINGYRIVELFKKGDLTNIGWVTAPDPPPLGTFIYGIFAHFDAIGETNTHEAIFRYDLTYTRLVSIFVASITAVVVMLFGWEFISPLVGIIGALVFSTIPEYLGLSQQVTMETFFTFFFTFCVYLFANYLKKPTSKKAYLVGTFVGLSLLIKLSDIFILPLLAGMYIVWLLLSNAKRKYEVIHKKYILMFLLGFSQFLFLWPAFYFHASYAVAIEKELRFGPLHSIPSWEWFFGLPVHVPKTYFIIQFLIRTPFLLLVLAFLGHYIVIMKKKWPLITLFLWFAIPFLQSFYAERTGGLRLVIEIYAPFSLLVGLGFSWILTIFRKIPFAKGVLVGALSVYVFTTLASISPYYIDYYNELVRGLQGVYKKNLFEIGWWGEGGKEAGEYIINHAKKHALIGYQVTPDNSLETSNSLTYEKFNREKQYAYVVTNYYYSQKVSYNNDYLKEDSEIIKERYKLVFEALADGVPLYSVYQNPNK